MKLCEASLIASLKASLILTYEMSDAFLKKALCKGEKCCYNIYESYEE